MRTCSLGRQIYSWDPRSIILVTVFVSLMLLQVIIFTSIHDFQTLLHRLLVRFAQERSLTW